MKIFNYIKIITIAIIIATLIIIGVITSILFFQKEVIIQKFIEQANQYINTPVSVEKIDITFLKNFPEISIEFRKINIKNSQDKKTLLKAESIFFALDPFQLMEKNYRINAIDITNGFCDIVQFENGKTNYEIFKNTNADSSSNIDFELDKIRLKNFKINFENKKNKIVTKILSKLSTISLEKELGIYKSKITGDLKIEKITINDVIFLSQTDAEASTNVVYDISNKLLNFSQTALKVNESEFVIHGDYSLADKKNIDFYFEGQDINLKNLIDILPNHTYPTFRKYNSKGNAYFQIYLKGNVSEISGPKMTILFGIKNGTIEYPNKPILLKNLRFEGTLINYGIYNLLNSDFELNKITGMLNEQLFSSNLKITNLNNPKVKFDFDGNMKINDLSHLFSLQQNNAEYKGQLNIDFSFDGKINDLKKLTFSNKVTTSGEILLNEISITHKKINPPIKNLSGKLLFNNNVIVMNNINGMYGKNDFNFNGQLNNLLAYVLLPNEPLGIVGKLNAKNLDLTEMLNINPEKENEPNHYYTRLSPNLRLKFDCNISNLIFKKFNSRNLSGSLLIKDQVMQFNDISFKSMGGSVKISGTADTKQKDDIRTNTKIFLDNIEVDSLFYVFENFEQDFVKSTHLKGKIISSADLTMNFDSLLNVKTNSITSNINITFKNGHLIEFGPLQELEKYLDGDKLNRLTFKDINSNFVIKNKTFFITDLELETNVTTLKLNGTHDFDNKIDYRIVTPIRPNKKRDKDERFGAIEKDRSGNTLLFLKLTGTTDDFKVNYDKTQVRKKIISDIKKEILELKQAFKKKNSGQKKTIKLSEKDYFDWDNKQ